MNYYACFICLDCDHKKRVDFPFRPKDLRDLKFECPKCGGNMVDLYYKEILLSNKNDQPILKIELQTLDSVPKILYEGTEINNLVDVEFEWDTRTDGPGETHIKIKHADKDDNKSHTVVKVSTIEHDLTRY